MDKDASVDERIFGVRNLRNYNNHKQVEELLKVLSDNSDDTQVRTTLAEALGWFRWSVKRPELLKSLHKIYKDKALPDELRKEIHQSILRLKYF
jgi:HEAT repeat protein